MVFNKAGRHIKHNFYFDDMLIDCVQHCKYLGITFLSERLHMKFCKLLLGVGKRATNLATLSELGRFPLHFDITKSMIRYWHRLENLGSSFPLLKDAYLESKLLSYYLNQKFPLGMDH